MSPSELRPLAWIVCGAGCRGRAVERQAEQARVPAGSLERIRLTVQLVEPVQYRPEAQDVQGAVFPEEKQSSNCVWKLE